MVLGPLLLPEQSEAKMMKRRKKTFNFSVYQKYPVRMKNVSSSYEKWS